MFLSTVYNYVYVQECVSVFINCLQLRLCPRVCECFYQLFTITSMSKSVSGFYQLFTLTSMSRSVYMSVFINCSHLHLCLGVCECFYQLFILTCTFMSKSV